MDNQITIRRYLRPEYPEYNNFGGITFIFTMDYDNNTVEVQFSICSLSDNFSKDIGFMNARLSDSDIYDLDEFRKNANSDNSKGFVNTYLNSLYNKLVLSEKLSNRHRTLLKMVKYKNYLTAIEHYLK